MNPSNTKDETMLTESEASTQKLSSLGDENFVEITASETSEDCLNLAIYKDGTLVDSVDIDPETEGIKDTVSAYFPYDEEASQQWHDRQDPDDINISDPPPTDPDNITYDVSSDVEEAFKDNMDAFPGEVIEALMND